MEEDGPSHEGGDSFPNAPPANIRRTLTPAQQLMLAEKRNRLSCQEACRSRRTVRQRNSAWAIELGSVSFESDLRI
ncbi:hypothetical protein EVAR_87293_1 [Eumeta japonica]|uniref:Uncharacterized protein n=1 Tax=Eumeta variegata TaxID=151549 RepID=A0A4C1VYA9_EUMVA|nr:hypothetical protein EVAR_87293_1 [Eumeta japonica]